MSSQSPPSSGLVTNPKLSGVNPCTLSPSRQHVRGETEVSETFVRNVSKVGLVHAPICREEAGEIRVVDGIRRVQAAANAGIEEIAVLVYDLTDAEAVEISLTLNQSVWNKSVTERDETGALRKLLGGPRRSYHEWESTEELFNAKYALGLADETDRMLHLVGDADGIGEATALALANTFESSDALHEATIEDLRTVSGVGPKKAQTIRTYLDTVDDDTDRIDVNVNLTRM